MDRQWAWSERVGFVPCGTADAREMRSRRVLRNPKLELNKRARTAHLRPLLGGARYSTPAAPLNRHPAEAPGDAGAMAAERHAI